MSYAFNVSPLVKNYTLEEFWALPEPADRTKLELINGVIFMTPPPEEVHDDTVSNLLDLLKKDLLAAANEGKLYVPRAAIWTSNRTYIEPDLFYISPELAARMKKGKRTTADLVIEVLSPGSFLYDRNTKKDTYAALGVRELWLVDESLKTVEVFNLAGERYDEGRAFQENQKIESQVLPFLAFTAQQVFA